MADMETITILRVGTDEAVRSISDLKQNIKELKDNLADLEIGSKEYEDTLDELKVNQNALKDAMYATSTSMEDLTKAATGTGESYNALVHRMAALKEELRATDVSTEAGAKRFRELAGQINGVNDKLKKMDAMQGNYQRNVGNYNGAVDRLVNSFGAMGRGAAGVIAPVRGVTSGLKAMSSTPVVAIMGLLASVIVQVTNALKSSEEGMEGATAAMGVFGGVSDALKVIMQGVGQAVGWLSQQLVKLAEKMGLVTDRMKEKQAIAEDEIRITKMERQNIRENAEAERDIAELRAKAVDRQKYSVRERIAFLEEAGRKEAAIADRNRKLAKAEYDLIVRRNAQTKSSAEDLKKEAEAYAKMIKADTDYAAAVRQNTQEINRLRNESARTAEKTADDTVLALEKVTTAMITKTSPWVEKLLAQQKAVAEEMKAINADLEENYKETMAEVEDVLDEFSQADLQAFQTQQATIKGRIAALQGLVQATSSVLGSLADMYEADGDASEKSAQRAKELRTASAIIDTISGAVAAYMNGVKTIPVPSWAGIALGATNAAAVFAAGIAQVKQISATKVGNGGGSSVAMPATVAAPSISPQVTSVRNITSASEEDRLNRMASEQRVVLVTSDLEVKQHQQRVQVQESTF